ncbi:MAG TPA: methyltransferase domain-containing protein [Povalibacter sp.]
MDSGRVVIPLLLALSLASCGRNEPPAATETPPPATAEAPPLAADPVQAALAASDRFAGDAVQDAWRKSPDVLALLDLKPGMRALDYFAGSGYYTELLSRLVGPEGHVYAYNNAEYAKYSGDKPAQRYSGNRLPNVSEVGGPPEQLALDAASLDAVLFNQAYHDLHWKSKDWTATDPAKSLAQVVQALKPGAVVVVVDHVAAAGSDPAASVDAMHRIDPAVVKREFTAAGLTLESESSFLANPADDHTKVVFDPAVSHKTDQFVFKFRKP